MLYETFFDLQKLQKLHFLDFPLISLQEPLTLPPRKVPGECAHLEIEVRVRFSNLFGLRYAYMSLIISRNRGKNRTHPACYMKHF